MTALGSAHEAAGAQETTGEITPEQPCGPQVCLPTLRQVKRVLLNYVFSSSSGTSSSSSSGKESSAEVHLPALVW